MHNIQTFECTIVTCQATAQSTNSVLTYTRPLVRLQHVPDVTPAYGAVLCVLTGVLAASVAVVTSYYRVNNMQP